MNDDSFRYNILHPRYNILNLLSLIGFNWVECWQNTEEMVQDIEPGLGGFASPPPGEGSTKITHL